jgi:hypothetical protein
MGLHTKERKVFCTCGRQTRLLRSSESIYGKDFGPVWFCEPCNAWVGVHRNSPTYAPLGKPADKTTRTARRDAHHAFDRLWLAKIAKGGISRGRARHLAYKWLALVLGVPTEKCHIGYFDQAMCHRVISVCSAIPITGQTTAVSRGS